jgi:hypothetical protein
MINLEMLALGAAVLLLLQLVAAVEARTRALPAAPRSGGAPAPRRPRATTARALDRDDAAASGGELAHA